MPGQAVVTIGAHRWTVSLAATFAELAQGLGGVPAIVQGTGMLFDLGQDQVARVTTVPMLFPLDIVFIHGSQGVVDLARNVPPGVVVASSAPARYFLEVNAGEAQGVEPGQAVEIAVAAQATPADLEVVASVMAALLTLMQLFSIVRGQP